jgi:hypothetical protein
MKIDELIDSLKKLRNLLGGIEKNGEFREVDTQGKPLNVFMPSPSDFNAEIMIKSDAGYDDIEEVVFDGKSDKYCIIVKDYSVIKAPK